MLYEPLRSGDEMDSLLKTFGISYKEEITSDVIVEKTKHKVVIAIL